MIDPHYPRIVIAFDYRNCRVEVEKDSFQGEEIYSVWVNYGFQCVVVTPCCYSKTEAIRKGKHWIDSQLIFDE